METIVYDVDYFIKKFSAIPEELWTVNNRINEKGQRCAHGWCCHTTEELLCQTFKNSIEEEFLEKIAKENLNITKIGGFALINNGRIKKYQQSTPKQRVLAALYDIKEAQDSQSEVKEKIVYVTVDKNVRKLQEKELSFQ